MGGGVGRCGAVWWVAAVAVAAVAAGCASGGGGAAAGRCPEPVACPEAVVVRAARAPAEGPAPTTERRRVIALKGFGDAGLVAFDVEDDLMGPAYQVYDPAKQQVVRSYPYVSLTAAQQWKKVVRSHGIREIGAGSEQRPSDGVTLVGAGAAGWVVFYAMKGERAVPVYRVPRLSDEAGDTADVRVTRLAWSPDGRWAVAVHSQALRQPRPWVSDFLHAFEVPPGSLPFD